MHTHLGKGSPGSRSPASGSSPIDLILVATVVDEWDLAAAPPPSRRRRRRSAAIHPRQGVKAVAKAGAHAFVPSSAAPPLKGGRRVRRRNRGRC